MSDKKTNNHDLKQIFLQEESINENDIISDTSQNERKAYHSHRKFYFTIGIIVIIMSIIGVVFSVIYAVRFFSDIINNTQQKEEFAGIIYPLVICDTSTFDDVKDIRNDTIIQVAAWDIILKDDVSQYKTEFDYIYVPKENLEQHAASLFGNNVSIEHKSIITSDIQFYYDEDISSYRIPYNPKYFSYSPIITEIKKDSDSYVLTVGYMSPSPSWIMNSDSEISPDKYMEYTLKKSDNNYIIVSVHNSDIVSENQSML